MNAGDWVTFVYEDREINGVIMHDTDELTTECTIRVRGGRMFRNIAPGRIISHRAPDPYVMRPNGQSLRTSMVWYSNDSTFHGERWHVRQEGSHGVTWIEMPQWAQDVAFQFEVRTRWNGHGQKKVARQTAQRIVDLAIEHGLYPFAMAAS